MFNIFKRIRHYKAEIENLQYKNKRLKDTLNIERTYRPIPEKVLVYEHPQVIDVFLLTTREQTTSGYPRDIPEGYFLSCKDAFAELIPGKQVQVTTHKAIRAGKDIFLLPYYTSGPITIGRKPEPEKENVK